MTCDGKHYKNHFDQNVTMQSLIQVKVELFFRHVPDFKKRFMSLHCFIFPSQEIVLSLVM